MPNLVEYDAAFFTNDLDNRDNVFVNCDAYGIWSTRDNRIHIVYIHMYRLRCVDTLHYFGDVQNEICHHWWKAVKFTLWTVKFKKTFNLKFYYGGDLFELSFNQNKLNFVWIRVSFISLIWSIQWRIINNENVRVVNLSLSSLPCMRVLRIEINVFSEWCNLENMNF